MHASCEHETRISTRSFYTHHVQRIVRNVVYYDALNIIEQVLAASSTAGVRRGLMAALYTRVTSGPPGPGHRT